MLTQFWLIIIGFFLCFGPASAQSTQPLLRFVEAPTLNVLPGEVYSHVYSFRNETAQKQIANIKIESTLQWPVLDAPKVIEIPPNALALVTVILQVPEKELAGSVNETRLQITVGANEPITHKARAQVRHQGKTVLRGISPKKENPRDDSFTSSLEVRELSGSFWVELKNESNTFVHGELKLKNEGAASVSLGQSPEVQISAFQSILIPISIVFTSEKNSALFSLTFKFNDQEITSPVYVVRYLDPLTDRSPGNGGFRLKGGLQVSSTAILVNNEADLEQRYALNLNGPVSDYFYASLLLQGVMTPLRATNNDSNLPDTMILHLQGARTEIELGWPLDYRLFGVPTDGVPLQGIRVQQFLENVDLGLAAGSEIDHGTLGAAAGAQFTPKDNQRLALVLSRSGALDRNQMGMLYGTQIPLSPTLTLGPTVSVVLSGNGDSKLWQRTLLQLKRFPKWPMFVSVESRIEPKMEFNRTAVRVSRLGEVYSAMSEAGFGIGRDLISGETAYETDVTAYVGKPLFNSKVKGGVEFQLTRLDGSLFIMNEVALGPRVSTRIGDKISIWAGTLGLFRQEDAFTERASSPGLRLDSGVSYETKNHSIALFLRRTQYENAMTTRGGAVRTENSAELVYSRKFELHFGTAKHHGVFSLFSRVSERTTPTRESSALDFGGRVGIKTGQVTWSLFGSSRPEAGVMMSFPLDVPVDKMSGFFGGKKGSVLTGTIRIDANPVPNAVLSLKALSGQVKELTARSDKEGRFIFDRIPTGSYRLYVEPGTIPAHLIWPLEGLSFDFSGKQKKTTEIALQPTRSVTILVFHDANQNAIYDDGERLEPQIRIKMMHGADLVAQSVTDSFGRVVFPRLINDDLTIELESKDLPVGATLPRGNTLEARRGDALFMFGYMMTGVPPSSSPLISIEADPEQVTLKRPITRLQVRSPLPIVDIRTSKIEPHTLALPSLSFTGSGLSRSAEWELPNNCPPGVVTLTIQIKLEGDPKWFEARVELFVAE